VSRPLTFALPKGRILSAAARVLAQAGFATEAIASADDRRLAIDLPDGNRVLFVKPIDVPTYVEHGAADMGVCGRDVLRERESDLLVPLDLEIGRCKMIVAAPKGAKPPSDLVRVATKYPQTAAAHFAALGVQAEIISLSGSVELAPLAGLADFIVDLVETGETLRQNGLEIVAEVAAVSTVVAVNRAAYKLRRAEIVELLERLRAALHGDPASAPTPTPPGA
jgi:ATP phosphoribosyltransferase